ncbi:MAG: hypothetical protein J5606_09425 [Bacteroidales bacterium]|nr:hypothetical protein [Bacteroidales bacterium]
MKKVVFTLVCVCFASILTAQDIIITKDAQKIEAKILEVSSTEIKYKKQNNLDGPTFVVSTSELNTIIYANGEVQLFDIPVNVTSETIESEQEQTETYPATCDEKTIPQKNIVDNQNANANTIAFKAVDFHGEALPQITYSKVEIPGTKHKRRRYWGEGVMFKRKEYGNFLKLYCPEAYVKYKAYRSFTAATWTCFVFVSMVGAIPFAVVADDKLEQSLQIYNNSCAGNSAIKLTY